MIFRQLHLFILFHQRKYRTILEITSDYKNDKKINRVNIRYQALSSFYLKNFHHSKICLETIKDNFQLSKIESNILAYLYARRNEKEKAITTWCTTLEKKSSNKTAQRALDYIRNKGRDLNLMDDEYFDSIKPAEPFLLPVTKILKTFLLVLLVLALIPGGYYVFITLKTKSFFSSKKLADKLDKVTLPDYNPNLLKSEKDGVKEFSFNEKELKTKFEKVKKKILSDDPVNAQILINQIKMSNASPEVKFKIEILEDFIEEPDYALFKNKIFFSDFIKAKNTYKNIYVKWHGRVVNLHKSKEAITFDFVLGDEEKGINEGIINVIFNKYVNVQYNEKLAVFGKIKSDNDIFFVEGIYVIKNYSVE